MLIVYFITAVGAFILFAWICELLSRIETLKNEVTDAGKYWKEQAMEARKERDNAQRQREIVCEKFANMRAVTNKKLRDVESVLSELRPFSEEIWDDV